MKNFNFEMADLDVSEETNIDVNNKTFLKELQTLQNKNISRDSEEEKKLLNYFYSIKMAKPNSRYTPVSNRSIITQVKERINYESINCNWSKDGSSIGLDFVINDYTDNSFSNVIRIENSYNKKVKLGIFSMIKVLICGNGMTVDKQLQGFSSKHTGNINIIAKNTINKIVKDFKVDILVANRVRNKLMEVDNIDDDKSKGIIGKAFMYNIINGNEARNIMKEKENYPFDYGDNNKTAWSLYNHFTRILTYRPNNPQLIKDLNNVKEFFNEQILN